MTKLTGKVVLLTGAGGGFGLEFIKQLLEKGCQLVLSDLSTEILDDLVPAMVAEAERGRVLGVVSADLSTLSGAYSVYTDTMALTPKIDVLINNAGIAVAGNFVDVPADRWETLMQINLLAPMRLTHRFLPNMIEQKSGHIVNLSSVAGLVATTPLSVYSASKFGLRGFSTAIGTELGQHNINVTTIYPFFSRTAILDAPQFGIAQNVPDQLVYEPDFIVSEAIKGIEKNKDHVYPGFIAKQMNMMSRYTPQAIPTMSKLLQRISG